MASLMEQANQSVSLRDGALTFLGVGRRLELHFLSCLCTRARVLGPNTRLECKYIYTDSDLNDVEF